MIIAARTSIGKSACALQFAWDLANNDIKVLFISLEMHVPALLERLFCNVMSIDNTAMWKREEIDKRSPQWHDYKVLLESKPIMFTDSLGKSWKEVNRFVESQRIKPDVVFIDHINHARPDANQDAKRTIDDYVRQFRTMAIRNNFAAVICAQVNRVAQSERKDKQPELHHLKGSGNLEEEADSILLLHWPYKYDNSKPKNKYQFIMAKNRNGQTGFIDIHYQPEYYRFSDWEEPSQQEYDYKQAQAGEGVEW